MTINSVIIFGGGISGLTAAHELLNKGINVTLVEKDLILGGMSKSKPRSEHSWRGYAPFYKNTFELMKRIPFENISVYDNLSLPVEFHILRDKIATTKPKLTVSDRIIITYYFLKFATSNKRRQLYFQQKLVPLLEKKLSKDGYDLLIEFAAGPGFGMEKKDVSMGHYLQFPMSSILNSSKYTHLHTHQHEYQHKASNFNGGWHVMNGPTHEKWIDPWVTHLKRKGLQVLLNTELKEFEIENGKIISAIVNDQQQMTADEYIVAIDPFNAKNIFKQSNMHDLYVKYACLTNKTDSKQISFTIEFDKPIEFPDNPGFVMSDSEFNITWYPQEKFWGEENSRWSGTIIEAYTKGQLYQKNAADLTKSELLNEIEYQILRSKSFQKLIYDKNGFYITGNDIKSREIWYEWRDDLTPLNLKWVNNIYNEKCRFSQATLFSNLFLSGAHTKTSINIWSTEGAIESGKLTANLILNKYSKPLAVYYKHDVPTYIKTLGKIDDILFKLSLPQLIDFIFIIILLFIFFLVFKSK